MENGHETFITLGVDPYKESERYRQVFVISPQLAEREALRNKNAYVREFLQDIPVSLAHSYYLKQGELHSENYQHPLFSVKKQIDRRERSGDTYKGFEKFETLIREQKGQENVVLWYSHAGDAGNEPPFNRINYDSGRLYFCFTGQDNHSIHIDIKINESRLPIEKILYQLEKVVSPYVKPKQTKEYLTHPFAMNMGAEEVIAVLRNIGYQQTVREYTLRNSIAYVSQRDSKEPTPLTYSDIIGEIEKQLWTYYPPKEIPISPFPSSIDFLGGQRQRPQTPEEIRQGYIDIIKPYVLKNGKVTLYGCSTTSTVDGSLFTDPIKAAVEITQSLGNPYATMSRVVSSGIQILKEPERYGKYFCPKCGGEMPGELRHGGGGYTEECPYTIQETGEPCGYRYKC